MPLLTPSHNDNLSSAVPHDQASHDRARTKRDWAAQTYEQEIIAANPIGMIAKEKCPSILGRRAGVRLGPDTWPHCLAPRFRFRALATFSMIRGPVPPPPQSGFKQCFTLVISPALSSRGTVGPATTGTYSTFFSRQYARKTRAMPTY